MKTVIGIGMIVSCVAVLAVFLVSGTRKNPRPASNVGVPDRAPTAFPTPTLKPIPPQYLLNNGGYHVFQTFNNCGPASLSMALSYYGINVSQGVIGEALRPYQNAEGDNDDKSVTLSELAGYAESYGFIAFHRPNGSAELLRRFVSSGLPVITRTLTKPGEDIGHFRVIKGYDDTSFIQDDSLQGKNLRYAYGAFNELWQAFNYEYLVLVPKERQNEAVSLLGTDVDTRTAWKRSAEAARDRIRSNPEDYWSSLNLSVALYHTGEYDASVRAYENAERFLPPRTLWYQIEPLLAYYETGAYTRVLAQTQRILESGNRAFSELYLLRGRVFEKLGDPKAARAEYARAVQYNVQFKEAREAYTEIERKLP